MTTDNKEKNDGWELIHVYTRAEAIADGLLIDVTETARQAGFRYPVAMTEGVWHKCVEVPPGVGCQDESGRLWDVLQVLLFTIRKSRGCSSYLQFPVSVINEHNRAEVVELKSHCGPGDNLEPVVTILLPNED